MTWQAAGCEARADECHYSPDYSGHGIVMDGFEGEIEASPRCREWRCRQAGYWGDASRQGSLEAGSGSEERCEECRINREKHRKRKSRINNIACPMSCCQMSCYCIV